MNLRFKRTKCNCKECPLDGQKKVLGIANFEKPKIVIIGEAPGKDEDVQGEPFVGASGAKLKEACASAGIVWHTAYKTNIVLCRPPNNAIDSSEGKAALECCLPGFKEELEWLQKNEAKVLVPTGNTALSALGIDGKIGKARGSVYQVGKMAAVPTYHPAFILRGMWKEEPTWIGDLIKAKDLSLRKWKPPKENFNLFPSVQDVKDFVKEALEENLLIGVDIETTSLSEFYSKIIVIGLASSGEDVLSVPLLRQGGKSYWTLKDEMMVKRELIKLFAKGRLVFQNALFDVRHLEYHGFPVGSVEHDTMLMHHCISPELPHNLGYIVSVYGDTPYWKEVVLGSEDRMINMDDQVLRTYNARDAAVMLQVLPRELEHLKQVGTEKTYRNVSMRLIKPLLRMSQFGIPLDQKKLKAKKILFTRRATSAEKKLKEVCELPEGFNLGSGDHLRLLVWGIEPKMTPRLKQEKAEIDGDPKRRKDTKKYLEICSKLNVFENTKALYRTTAKPRMTDGGSVAVDGEALIAIERAALNRYDAMRHLVRKTEKWEQERKDIEKLLVFLREYRKYADAEKLASTFSGFPVGPDGRVHPSYKIHGTATGRLSASDPNPQNFPSDVQDVFVAPAGYAVIKADYSNIELRVLAYITGEELLIKTFESGKNIHDMNCKLLFGIDESHPQWKIARRAAKVYVFGRSYGGGVNGIYEQLIVAVPELNLTFEHFKEMDKKYFEKLSKYRAWVEKQQKTARDTRCVTTAFGRKRFLLGTPDEIERMALNTPIQGTAGEVALNAIIELDEKLQKAKLNSRMFTTVHDSILVLSPINEVYAVAKTMKIVMEKEYTIEGRKVRFPVDIEVGPSWGETVPIEEWQKQKS